MASAITIKSCITETAKLALPVMGSRLLYTLTNIGGILMVASLGKETLAASALMSYLQLSITVILISILFSVGAMVSQNYGAKRYRECGQIFQQGFLLSCGLSLIAMFIFYKIGPILTLLKQPKTVITINVTYFKAFIWATPALFLNANLLQFIVAVKKQAYAFLLNAFFMLCQLSFSYMLIFGHFFMPKLGVAGLGYAFAISAWLQFLIGMALVLIQQDYRQFAIFRWTLKSDYHYLKKLFSIGWAISVHVGTELIASLLLMILTGWLGANALAARQINAQMSLLFIIPVFGISQAANVAIGHAIGQQRYRDLNRIGYINTSFGLGLMLIAAILYIFFPIHIIRLFVHESTSQVKTLIELATILLSIAAIRQFFDAVRNVLTGALRGMYDTKIPMLASLFCIWLVGVPTSCVLGFMFHLGVIGLSLGNMTGIIVGSLLILYRWHWRVKQYL